MVVMIGFISRLALRSDSGSGRGAVTRCRPASALGPAGGSGGRGRRALCLVAGVTVIFAAVSCARRETAVLDAALKARSVQPDPEALACARCHPRAFAEWAGSQHALANRLVTDAQDAGAFEPARRLTHGSFETSMERAGRDRYRFATRFSNEAVEVFHAEAVIGITPLRQYLVSFPGGRLQVMDTAYDPRSNEWFNAFGDENRQPHEWGHWKGRSMTWNVQCAFCHMTGFEKNYEARTDTYTSTWRAMGISCSQCHTPVRPATLDQCAVTGGLTVVSAERRMDNCASCHARREELFGSFKAGDSFYDHFRLVLPDQPGVFHADGQVREEDFEYASFKMSRMGHVGVSCMDCHSPHSGQLVLPAVNNALCLQCHNPPGRRGAPPIEPTAHSFHAADSPGNRCVECHMPVNVYMMRDGRRDHGFTSPDPLLTIEHGIPNACHRCHADQTPEWAERITRTWYGNRMERRARERSRIVARAHAGEATVGTPLLALARSEEITAWRAALIGLLEPWSGDPQVRDYLRTEVAHPHPLVRSAAVRALGEAPAATLADTSALVRVDAAMIQYRRNPLVRPAPMDELLAYLENISDQPAGALRQAEMAALAGRPGDAEAWARRALAWDPSAVPHHALGRIQFQHGKPAEAISNLHAAAVLEAGNAAFSYDLALALAESSGPATAIPWLEETLRRDPEFGRAWLNLGLAYAGVDRLRDAVGALRRAEALLPGSGDPAYARATVHLRMNDRATAVQAARAALAAEAGHPASLRLLRELERR